MLVQPAAERAVVEAAVRRRDLVPRVREWLEMVEAAALGFDLAAVAAWSGHDARTTQKMSRSRARG